MPTSLRFIIDRSLYLRDPEETALGKKIVAESILLLDELGYDAFTFKKLAARMGSTEASIYRYFKHKHQLLCYLVSWYWVWLEYLIRFRTNNITEPKERLSIAITTLLEADQDDPNVQHIDESALHRVVIEESARVYMTRPADEADYQGMLTGYNVLCERLLECIQDIDPRYQHGRELVETLLAAAHNRIFAVYQAGDGKAKRADRKNTEAFLNHLVLSTLEQ